MYKENKHQHSYEVTGEYESKGKNIIGKMVKCTIEKVICSGCNETNIRLKKQI